MKAASPVRRGVVGKGQILYLANCLPYNRIICLDRVSVGSLNQCVVHVREVFKSAVLSSAAAVLLIHNHPSGDPEPSREDREITRRLKDAGDLLGIPVLDHIIIGEEGYLSFVERGLL